MIAYLCEEHGFQWECNVDESGQRICEDCGMAVTGITITGWDGAVDTIRDWSIYTDWDERRPEERVIARTPEEALDKADTDGTVTEIYA